ncbi:MAG: hypothetical protein PHW27_07370, partial [Melioribacteraceae bacterium]|nr:hypothetical protein [Melioribacteraceae bacterium]
YNEFIGLNGTDVVSEEYRDKVKKNILSNYELPYEVLGREKTVLSFGLNLRDEYMLIKAEALELLPFVILLKGKSLLMNLKEAKKISDRFLKTPHWEFLGLIPMEKSNWLMMHLQICLVSIRFKRC